MNQSLEEAEKVIDDQAHADEVADMGNDADEVVE